MPLRQVEACFRGEKRKHGPAYVGTSLCTPKDGSAVNCALLQPMLSFALSSFDDLLE